MMQKAKATSQISSLIKKGKRSKPNPIRVACGICYPINHYLKVMISDRKEFVQGTFSSSYIYLVK